MISEDIPTGVIIGWLVMGLVAGFLLNWGRGTKGDYRTIAGFLLLMLLVSSIVLVVFPFTRPGAA